MGDLSALTWQHFCQSSPKQNPHIWSELSLSLSSPEPHTAALFLLRCGILGCCHSPSKGSWQSCRETGLGVPRLLLLLLPNPSGRSFSMQPHHLGVSLQVLQHQQKSWNGQTGSSFPSCGCQTSSQGTWILLSIWLLIPPAEKSQEKPRPQGLRACNPRGFCLSEHE